MKQRYYITQDFLKSRLKYDEITGIFTWIFRNSNRIKIGDRAGALGVDGYIYIRINDILYKSHRLAFLYVYGYLPEEVDHINMIKDDNRICNLRDSNKSKNGWNKKVRSDSKSGHKGVHYDKEINKYQAKIMANKISYFIGRFDTIEEAAAAYEKAAIELHGEFARSK